MAKAVGMKLPWEALLGDCIAEFWADDNCGRGNYGRLPKVFVKP